MAAGVCHRRNLHLRNRSIVCIVMEGKLQWAVVKADQCKGLRKPLAI